MSYTHQKRPYHATCRQYIGDNPKDIIEALTDKNTCATQYGADCIMVRFKVIPPGGRQIETLTPGWWVVTGENGLTKCYDDATFRVKYEELK